MSETRRRRIPLHVVLLIVVLGAIAGAAYCKHSENRRVRDAYAAWQVTWAKLMAEQSAECQQIAQWIGSLEQQPGSRQLIEQKLNGGDPLPVKKKGSYRVARWKHPELGIWLTLSFSSDKLVDARFEVESTSLRQAHPQPPMMAAGYSEAIRRDMQPWAVAVWVVAFLVALGWRRFGLIAAEISLVAAVAISAAWLVAPMYDVTLRGIFSNDRLFFGLVMYVCSVIALAMCVPREVGPNRFTIGSLLWLTAAVALLLSLAPVGYVGLAALVTGWLVFAGYRSLQQFASHKEPVPVGSKAPTV